MRKMWYIATFVSNTLLGFGAILSEENKTEIKITTLHKLDLETTLFYRLKTLLDNGRLSGTIEGSRLTG